MTIKYIIEDDYYRVLDPDGNEIARGSKKDKRYTDIIEHGIPGEYRIIQPEVKVGLIAAQDGPQTPNNPPEWVSSVLSTFTAGTAGTHNLNTNTADAEGETLSYALDASSTPWPSGVSMASNGIITVTSGATAGVTTGIRINVNDGVNADVLSPALTLTIEAASALSHSYPKVSAYRISGQADYADAAVMARIAQYDHVIMGFYPGWSLGGYNPKTYSDAILALNPNIALGTYTNLNECRTDASSAAWDELKNYLFAQTGPGALATDWWARDSAGNRLSSYSGSNVTNYMSYVQADANGDKYPEYFAKYNDDKFFGGASYNCVFCDVFGEKPRVNADWDGDGVNEDKDGAAIIAEHRAAHVEYVAQIRAVNGIEDVIINGTNWWQEPVPAEYNQVFSGCIIEGAYGLSWSIEGTTLGTPDPNVWGTWEKMMAAYRRFMAGSREPKLVSLNAQFPEADYRSMRYMLGSTLMDNGYFCPTPKDISPQYSAAAWYDEFDFDLGQPVDTPRTAAYESGVYLREFDNGLAVVNPRTNGEQTITLPSAGTGFHWELINGTQAPSINTGATVTTLTIADADGRIVKRVAD